MGEGTGHGELTIIPEPSRHLVVDSEELRTGQGRLGWVAERLADALRGLTGVEVQLLAAGRVPGGAISAAPARSALALGVLQLRSVADKVGELGSNLGAAALQYEEKETIAQRLFALTTTAGAAWKEAYGSWFVSPLRMLTVPISRFYVAAAQRRRETLAPNQRWAGGGPLWSSMLTEAGLVYYHEIASLSPTGWPGYANNVLGAARLLPQALRPLRDISDPGLDRDGAALLARNISGTVVPGGEVSDGAALVASGVADLHGILGHQGFRMEPARSRPGDDDPARAPVRSFERALAVMEELDPSAGATYGELRIDRVTSAQGEHSWQVFIPGGQGFNPTNVHSLLHAVSSVDSNYTPSVMMVAQALRDVGAVKGEPIVVTGHSHGGITSSLFANDPRMRAEFDVALVITAGSPIDLHEIRPDTHVVSFEHTEDPIPGVDGISRALKPGLTRVERTLADSADPTIGAGRGIYHSHDYPNYVDTARIADGHPELAHVRGLLEAVIPEGEVRTYRFRADITTG